jgi:hypothetical protein
MAQGKWRKSSFSGDTANSDCIEVLLTAHRAGIRDSKDATGPALAVTADTWVTFVTRVTYEQ